MTLPSVHMLLQPRELAIAAAALAAGLAVGVLYFGALWWNVRRLAAGGSAALAALVTLARFAVLAGALFAASRFGAMTLVAATLGIVAARRLVTRRIGERAR